MKAYKKKEKIQWHWAGRAVIGHIVDVFFKPITKEIKGKKIKRNASEENPAYLVESEAGNQALKLHTELSKAQAAKKPGAKTAKQPQMFS